uniref:Uncharacterized protein n=1 Tax=Arundo donax TaxID=35708 RepID=A0A0A8ZTX8_ARUDO
MTAWCSFHLESWRVKHRRRILSLHLFLTHHMLLNQLCLPLELPGIFAMMNIGK